MLGEGSTGAIYEAIQLSPRRPIALKLLRTASLSPSLLKRFQLEVELLGRLEHPRIARAFTMRGRQRQMAD